MFVQRSHFGDIKTQRLKGERGRLPGGGRRPLRARWTRAVRHMSFAEGLCVKLTGRRRERLRIGCVFILPRGLRGRAAEAEGRMVGSLSLGWEMLSEVVSIPFYMDICMAGDSQIISYLLITYTFLHDAIDRPNAPLPTKYKHASLEKTRRTASH